MMAKVRTLTVVAVTAGAGRDVHKAIQIQDSDMDRPYHGLEARCGSDRGRPNSISANRLTDAEVTCAKCLRFALPIGNSRTFDMS